MAVLSEIRKRPVFLIAIIGLALFAFIIQEAFTSGSSKVDVLGGVDGNEISRQEFTQALESARARYGGGVSEMTLAQNVWNGLVAQKVFEKEVENAGITVGEADIMNQLYNDSNIRKNPKFQTAGLFDKEKFKEFLVLTRAEYGGQWKEMQKYMATIEQDVKRNTYSSLINVGLGNSKKEAELQYLADNTKADGQLVYIPFTSVADSLITIQKSEIQSYIDKHPQDFEVNASRDLEYVKFEITPSKEDEEAVKKEVEKLINDREEYSPVTKGNITIKGLRNTTNYNEYFNENNSDIPLNEKALFKSEISKVIVDSIFDAKKGTIYGPYQENGIYKISKVESVLQLPDSVEASHILIAYKGSLRGDNTIKRNKEQAKKVADSLLTVLKSNRSKFPALVKQYSSDKGSVEKNGKYEWFGYNTMTPAFRDFVFENKKGSMDVVETPFGYHIIKVDNQKNFQKAIKLITFGRKIEASETTENQIFQEAEKFAQTIASGKKINESAKENNVKTSSAQSIKALDEFIPGLGNERQIVSWAFGKETKIGDYKRFDVNKGYVVAVLTSKTKKGLMPVDKAISRVKPLLINDKKAAIINAKITGNSLEEIAKSSDSKVETFADITMKAPTIAGVGFDPKIVGAIVNSKENKLYTKITGTKGVYAYMVSKREAPEKLEDYTAYQKQLAEKLKNKNGAVIEAIKNTYEIENNLNAYYGIEE